MKPLIILQRQHRIKLAIGKGLYELLGVGVVHAAGVREQVKVAAHTLDGAAQLAVLELEVFAPEVEELFHLLLSQVTLVQRSKEVMLIN